MIPATAGASLVAFAEAHALSGDGKLVGHATSSIAVLWP